MRFLATLLLLAPAAAWATEAAPCIAVAGCTERVTLGGGPSRSLVYRTYALDAPNPRVTRALVMIYGAGRDADNYFRAALASAFLAGALYTVKEKETDEQLKKQLALRPATLLLGEIDILPLGGFDSSCSAMTQGPTRLARGQAFGKFVNEKYGAKHVTTVVSPCGHNARCMFTAEAALPILFPKAVAGLLSK